MPDDRRLGFLQEFEARMSNVGPQAVLDRSAAEALAAFEAAGVAALLLKGPALAQRLYLDGEHRSYVDIDVLVEPSRVEQARAALRGLGYNTEGTQRAGVDDFLGVLHAETWASPDGCGIDLHWRLPGWDVPAPTAWALLYRSADTIEVGGKRARILGRGALALHVATHAAQSGPHDAKAIGDLTRAVERWPASHWREAADLAARLQATDALASGLRLLGAGALLAARLGLPASARTSWSIHNRALRPRGTFHLRALVEAPGLRVRARILRRSLLPGRAWITAQKPWARRSGSALVAAYVIHIVQAPVWAARAWRFDRRERRASEQRPYR